ncbi:MAG: hypothetical protein CBC13_02735 [Planctomycetia bacterium TMED53]|nr:MAG: hypothetical protein CBC13_02735 [Planctomycetia bacterium TMED53]
MGVDLRDVEKRWQDRWRENPLPSPVAIDDAELAKAMAKEAEEATTLTDASTTESDEKDALHVDQNPEGEEAAAAGEAVVESGSAAGAEKPAQESSDLPESASEAEASSADSAATSGDSSDSRKKGRRKRRHGPRTFFCLDMFPYPSLDGFSVSQLRGIATNDVVARYQQSRGRRVLRPIGWDAFQATVEDEARQNQISPREVVQCGIDLMQEQLRRFGALVHWDHQIDTSEPADYRWSQWLFLQLLEKGLVHQDEQGWKVAITDYAEPLHSGLKHLKWPPRTKALQRNWIGRREGTKLALKARSELYDGWEELEVFCRRLEALPEASFIVLCPEHPLLEKIVDPILEEEVRQLQERTAQLDERERLAKRADADGVATGAFALNPATLNTIPIWVSSYVMPHIRFGAILGMPEENEAHKEFAVNHGIPLTGGHDSSRRRRRPSRRRQGGEGSAEKKGLQGSLESRGVTEPHIDYKLHDWVFDRQRFWGVPIPVIECVDCGSVPVPEADLPVRLPEVDQLEDLPEGENPLEKFTDWVDVACPSCGTAAKRSVDTMPDWIGSCWGHLRCLDPGFEDAIASSEHLQRWTPANLCVGGIEHAELHLMYVRFISHFLADLKVTPRQEPYRRLFNQGRIRSQENEDGEEADHSRRGPRVIASEYLERYGADALRLHLLFMGPPQDHAEWSDEGLKGCARFLQRTYEGITGRIGQGKFVSRNVLVAKHRLIRRVSRAIRTYRLNKAVSAFMEFVKLLRGDEFSPEEVDKQTLKTFTILLAPFAPHMAHELWDQLGESGDLTAEPWPEHSDELLQPTEIELAIFVNDSLVDRISVELEATKNQVIDQVLELETVKARTGGKSADRVIHVPDRLLKLIYSSSRDENESPAEEEPFFDSNL